MEVGVTLVHIYISLISQIPTFFLYHLSKTIENNWSYCTPQINTVNSIDKYLNYCTHINLTILFLLHQMPKLSLLRFLSKKNDQILMQNIQNILCSHQPFHKKLFLSYTTQVAFNDHYSNIYVWTENTYGITF